MKSAKEIGNHLVVVIGAAFVNLEVSSPADQTMAILGYALGAWLGEGGNIDEFVAPAHRLHRLSNRSLQ